MTNKTDRKIISLLKQYLRTVKEVDNPADTKGKFRYYDEATTVIDEVCSILDEFMCYDLPNWRREELAGYLEDELEYRRGVNDA